MAELRVALPGVQVLFAFLLILPFNSRFERMTPFQEKLYLATLLAAALSTMLLIAPTLQHRLQFRRDLKARILADSQRLALAGLALLALAVVGSVALVGDFVFGGAVAAVAAGICATACLLTWLLLPLRGRNR